MGDSRSVPSLQDVDRSSLPSGREDAGKLRVAWKEGCPMQYVQIVSELDLGEASHYMVLTNLSRREIDMDLTVRLGPEFDSMNSFRPSPLDSLGYELSMQGSN